MAKQKERVVQVSGLDSWFMHGDESSNGGSIGQGALALLLAEGWTIKTTIPIQSKDYPAFYFVLSAPADVGLSSVTASAGAPEDSAASAAITASAAKIDAPRGVGHRDSGDRERASREV